MFRLQYCREVKDSGGLAKTSAAKSLTEFSGQLLVCIKCVEELLAKLIPFALSECFRAFGMRVIYLVQGRTFNFWFSKC